MFTVKTPEEASSIIRSGCARPVTAERISLEEACGRVLAEDINASEYVPDFHRSTVDGYALRASDTFGCSDAIPAILPVCFSVEMGCSPEGPLPRGCCAYVPTGGAVPEGADAVVMIEYTEDYGDGSIGISKAASPGSNLIYRGNDVYPGKKVLTAGRRLTASDIGALAAMGILFVPAAKLPVIGILSTGDELIPPDQKPVGGQIRDVNSLLLDSLCRELGAIPRRYGIVEDDPALLTAALEGAMADCDAVLISGGSSVGARDATAEVIEAHGELLFHGIAMKPGKPTIFGLAGNTPVFGLPGHPVAAFFITRLFVRAMIEAMTGEIREDYPVAARLSEAVSANHGRCETMGVQTFYREGQLYVRPIRTKSGLISSLAGSDGFITIPRDCEGLPAGAPVELYLY